LNTLILGPIGLDRPGGIAGSITSGSPGIAARAVGHFEGRTG
jgi:hypothetical protein